MSVHGGPADPDVPVLIAAREEYARLAAGHTPGGAATTSAISER